MQSDPTPWDWSRRALVWGAQLAGWTRFALALGAGGVGVGCQRNADVTADVNRTSARFTYEHALAGRRPQIGQFTAAQVDELWRKLRALRFPVPEAILSPLLPADLRAVPLVYVDAVAAREGQPVGGMVQDFWLNSRSVLRTGVSYHRSENRLEWVDLLSNLEAMDRPVRPPFSGPPTAVGARLHAGEAK